LPLGNVSFLPKQSFLEKVISEAPFNNLPILLALLSTYDSFKVAL